MVTKACLRSCRRYRPVASWPSTNSNSINLEATRAIAEASGIHVTASGGVATLDDIYAVKELEEFGVDSVIVGKALYEGVFTLEEALEAAED
ncbi:hypothetical protein C2W62_06555 [Candidatus Entotheonella serta]|nr:hypothetical protein C2W62_06555 [Candidatus Entotheonella serta]